MNKQKGPVPKSRENGVITNSRVNAKLEDSTRWYAHLPIIYKKPIFRKAVRSPADHTPRERSQTRSQRKTKGERAQLARTLILLLAQQESKTRGRGSEGTHHHSFRNVFIRTYSFFEMHTFTLIPFFFEIHIISSTIFAAARHELGRR